MTQHYLPAFVSILLFTLKIVFNFLLLFSYVVDKVHVVRTTLADNYLLIWIGIIVGVLVLYYWDSIMSKLPKPKSEGNMVGSKSDQRFKDLEKASMYH